MDESLDGGVVAVDISLADDARRLQDILAVSSLLRRMSLREVGRLVARELSETAAMLDGVGDHVRAKKMGSVAVAVENALAAIGDQFGV